jgi:hypothetical protein
MRTKTILLSALLGGLGSVSVIAQTNVYSLNAVGYINVTCAPGYTMISAPLIATPDNTIGTLINNSGSNYTGDSVYFYNPSSGFSLDTAENVGNGTRGTTTNANGWAFNGTNVLAPGVGCWFDNVGATPVTLTFVGTVPSGSLTNTLLTGYTLAGSILPTSGDLCSNALTTLTNYNEGDSIYTYSGGTFTIFQSGTGRGQGGHGYSETPSGNGGIGDWSSAGDPTIPNVGEGFWYYNSAATVNWVENFSVSE